MSKEAKKYCDKCGSPRGLELVANKKEEQCDYCGKMKPCNVIEAKKVAKVIEETKQVIDQKQTKPKSALKKSPIKKVPTPKVEIKAEKKITPKKK